MDLLTPCGSCARHVKATETHCPFCGACAAPAPAPTGEPFRRMVAAAAVAAGVAAIVATEACSSSSGTVFYGAPDIMTDASTTDGNTSAIVYYGFPGLLDADTDAATTPDSAATGDATAPKDAAAQGDAGGAADGTTEDSPSVVAFYGIAGGLDAADKPG
jgi:hypothetical protein